MTTRFNSRSQTRFGVTGLPSGYDSVGSSTLTIPSVGLEDVDRSLFELFNKEISLQVSIDGATKRVPIIFAAGEKWASIKNSRSIRDSKGSLILPLIVIGRNTVQQLSNSDIAGRGINQQTGEIVVRRRLDSSDRGYQSLVNRLLVKHQQSLAVAPAEGEEGQLTTVRSIGDLSEDPVIQDGGLLVADRTNNVYETIVVPAPQFYSAVYEVIVWTQYQQHMNQIIETLIASFLPQGNAWKLTTPAGYWFIATVDNNTYSAETNFDDLSQHERLVKHKFTITVPAYVLASSSPGSPVPIKRYVSSPTISFDVGTGSDEELGGGLIEPFLGSDDPTLPLDDVKNRRPDQRRTNGTRLYSPGDHDPALDSPPRGRQGARFKKVTGIDRHGRRITKLVRVSSLNPRSGETVFAPDASLGGIDIIIEDG